MIRIVKIDANTYWLVMETDLGSSHTVLTEEQVKELQGVK